MNKLVNIHVLITIFLLWFTSFGWGQDIWSLQQCIDTAKLYNINLRIDRNNIELSKEKNLEVKAGQYPKISVNGDYKYFPDLPHQLMPVSAFNPTAPKGEFKDVQFGVPHNINAGIQLTLPLFNPQIKGAIKNTWIASRIAELQLNQSEEQIYFDITTLYYNAQILLHQLDFVKSNQADTEKLLSNLQLLHEHKMVLETDVNRVKLQSDQLKNQLEHLNNKYAQIVDALKLTMGIPVEKEFSIDPDILVDDPVDYSFNQNIDIHIALTQHQMLSNELDILNKTGKYPTLHLIASYGTTGFGYDRSPSQFLKFYGVSFAGIQMNYSLYDGALNKRKIAQKKIEIQNNQLRTALLSEKNNLQIKNALREVESAQRQIVSTRNHIEQARKIYDQTVLRQKQGTSNLTDVLLADNALREARQDHLSAIVDYLKADLELKKYTGNITHIK